MILKKRYILVEKDEEIVWGNEQEREARSFNHEFDYYKGAYYNSNFELVHHTKAASALVMNAFILAKRGRYTNAISCCNKALATHPNFAKAWQVKATCLKELGEKKEAINCYDKVTHLQPNHWSMHLLKAELLSDIGKKK